MHARRHSKDKQIPNIQVNFEKWTIRAIENTGLALRKKGTWAIVASYNGDQKVRTEEWSERWFFGEWSTLVEKENNLSASIFMSFSKISNVSVNSKRKKNRLVLTPVGWGVPAVFSVNEA